MRENERMKEIEWDREGEKSTRPDVERYKITCALRRKTNHNKKKRKKRESKYKSQNYAKIDNKKK